MLEGGRMAGTVIKAVIIHSGPVGQLRYCLTSLRHVVTDVIICLNNNSRNFEEIEVELSRHRSYFRGRVEYIGEYETFRDLRNRSLEFVEPGEYVLQIDSDERVVGDLRGIELKADGYRIEVTSPHIQRGNRVVVQRDYVFRLFKYYEGFRYVFGVHEQISWNYLDKWVEELNFIKIKHIGYDISESEMDLKVRRNLGLLLREVSEFGPHSYMFYHLGESYLWLGDIRSALKYYEMALERGEILNSKLNLDIREKANRLRRIAGGGNLYE